MYILIMVKGGFFFDGRDASWIADAVGFCSSETRRGKKTLSSLWQHEQTNRLALRRTGMEN